MCIEIYMYILNDIFVLFMFKFLFQNCTTYEKCVIFARSHHKLVLDTFSDFNKPKILF